MDTKDTRNKGQRGRVVSALDQQSGAPGFEYRSGAFFSKVPIINGPGKLSPFSLKIEVSIVLHVT